MEVFGIQPGARYPHPITEFRCAAQVIANALTAQQQGCDAFVIGHFQEAGLAVSAQIGQFNRAFDDQREYRSLREAFVAQAKPMLGLGIDVIIPAGG